MFTRWLIFHVASGQSFFAGIACLVFAACLSAFAGQWRSIRPFRSILACLGGILVFASATPLPLWSYLGLAVVSLLWLAAEGTGARVSPRLVHGLRIVVSAMWIAAALFELPYHLLPSMPRLDRPVLGIIGDSVTAGLGDPESVTWPGIFEADYGVVVRDHARAGADVASALRQAASVSPDERLVLLEIGGNDILGGTAPAEFAAGLDELLSAVVRPGRTIVMLELPLPPTYNAYGRIQRRLAHQYRALLVPKRVLLGILQQEGSTLDAIHLSPEGHRGMAAAIWDVVRSAYEDEGRP